MSATVDSESMSTNEEGNNTVKFSDIEWLRARLDSYKISSILDKFDVDVEIDTSIDEIQNQVTNAFNSLQEAASMREIRKLALHSLKLSENLTEILVSNSSTADEDPKDREVRRLVNRGIELDRDLLHIYADIRPMEMEVLKLKQENRELMDSNRKLVSKAAEANKEKQSVMVSGSRGPQYNELMSSYVWSVKKLDMVQKCFLGCILGSAVKWADDDELLSLVEELDSLPELADDAHNIS